MLKANTTSIVKYRGISLGFLSLWVIVLSANVFLQRDWNFTQMINVYLNTLMIDLKILNEKCLSRGPRSFSKCIEDEYLRIEEYFPFIQFDLSSQNITKFDHIIEPSSSRTENKYYGIHTFTTYSQIQNSTYQARISSNIRKEDFDYFLKENNHYDNSVFFFVPWILLWIVYCWITSWTQDRWQEERIISQKVLDTKHCILSTLECLEDGLFILDKNKRIQYMNTKAQSMTGWIFPEALGRRIEDVYEIVSENEQPLENFKDKISMKKVKKLRMKDNYGSERFIMIEDFESPVESTSGKVCFSLVFRDVTAAKEVERKLLEAADCDGLTGLLNRRAFDAFLVKAVNSAKEHKENHALCFLDLDKFKPVNDICGHQAGDELIRQIGQLIKRSVRHSDIVARVGGDEFAVIFVRCDLKVALKISEKICDEIHDLKFCWNSTSFSVGASIGLVSVSSESPGLAEVMKSADSACYAAKATGKGKVIVLESPVI
eukprot:GHVP01054705.1.p1 GENE.GHVP01054705.1~~GHVP01054705.1.p1  ORF type:complete len:489 (+),score=89.68 GHVP01054705.1:138-1604(+)